MPLEKLVAVDNRRGFLVDSITSNIQALDTIANVTASVGIDVTTPDFWRSAVESVLVQVRRFVELANQEA